MGLKKWRLGIHSYALHLWGFGQNWCVHEPYPKAMDIIHLMDWAKENRLDGLHITGCDLETKDNARLAEVASAAKERGLYLEYNCSLDEEFDARLNETFESGVLVAHKLGAEIAKFNLDIRRPKPLYGSCLNPSVMRQLADIHDRIKAALPIIEKYNMPIAIENHTETYADEVLWLINSVNHPLVKVCVDTVNSFGVLEGPEEAVNKLAPHAICNHLCDHELTRDQYGARFHGVAVGDGDMDIPKIVGFFRRVCLTDKITFEIEWDMENDTLEDARKKQMDACKRSISYLRDVIKVGREDESAYL
jgi:sugar phosphate isomerase/epimerase